MIQVGITWKQCAGIPSFQYVYGGTFAVINGKVYYGGGWRDVYGEEDDDFNVYCYDPPQDNWTTLPPLPVSYFGLGQVMISSKLVVVGEGINDSYMLITNEVFTYDERSVRWKQTISPIPTARSCSGVLSLESAPIVAGGSTTKDATNVVEIYKPDTSQWYSTDPLLTPCREITLNCIGNMCYAMGGCEFPSLVHQYLNQTLYASVDDLLHNAVPANQTTHSGSSDTQSAWKTLPNTPTYRSTADVLAGKLLTIGEGEETSKAGGAVMSDICMYSPSANSWLYFSDLSEPQSYARAAVLSSTEILVIGAWHICKQHCLQRNTKH